MVGSVFISYRREDTAADARSIYQRLQRAFGSRQLFMDVDSIQRGRDFQTVLDEHLAKSQVMLAVMGPRWSDARDEQGNRRLDDPDDFVRLEVGRALQRDIAVIPVLVGGARIPKAADLPADLRALTRRQGITVTHENFPRDMDTLERDIRALFQRPKPWRLIAATSAAIVVVAAAVLAFQFGVPIFPSGSNTTIEEATGAPAVKDQAQGQAASEKQRQTEAKRAAEEAERQRLAALQAEDARQRAEAEAARKRAEADPLRPGRVFRDCSDVCPEMVVVPAGEFIMGSPNNEERYSGYDGREEPQRKVTIARPFAVAKFEVTFAEWEACVAGGGCASNKSPSDEGWGKAWRPVINVSWDDAKEYVAWLSRKTGKSYRLLTEAEWEYAARGVTSASIAAKRYWWGDQASHEYANYGSDSCCSGLAQERDQWVNTAPVGQFPTNPFGLHDMHGNVWEWCEDNWHSNYQDAPQDGSVWQGGDTSLRVLRGGSWGGSPQYLRSAVRVGNEPGSRVSGFGFRVARTL